MDSLLAMGFQTAVAESALLKHNGNLELALDELLLIDANSASNTSDHQVQLN